MDNTTEIFNHESVNYKSYFILDFAIILGIILLIVICLLIYKNYLCCFRRTCECIKKKSVLPEYL